MQPMPEDPNKPVVLTTRPTEARAALIVAALDEHGVKAEATGGFSAGLRAAAPGEVRILVRACDLEKARDALREIESGAADADQS